MYQLGKKLCAQPHNHKKDEHQYHGQCRATASRSALSGRSNLLLPVRRRARPWLYMLSVCCGLRCESWYKAQESSFSLACQRSQRGVRLELSATLHHRSWCRYSSFHNSEVVYKSFFPSWVQTFYILCREYTHSCWNIPLLGAFIN